MDQNQLIELLFTHSVTFSFFCFRVTWPGNRVRKNLPIDFEILILNFEPPYGFRYIKRKHVICRTQKHALKSNSKILVKITVIFPMSGQNDHFAPKWAKVVMWHSIRKRMSSIFQRKHFRGKNCAWDFRSKLITWEWTPSNTFPEQKRDHRVL